MEPPKFTVELVKLPPKLQGKIVESVLTIIMGLPPQIQVKLAESVLPHLIVASRDLVLGI